MKKPELNSVKRFWAQFAAFFVPSYAVLYIVLVIAGHADFNLACILTALLLGVLYAVIYSRFVKFSGLWRYLLSFLLLYGGILAISLVCLYVLALNDIFILFFEFIPSIYIFPELAVFFILLPLLLKLQARAAGRSTPRQKEPAPEPTVPGPARRIKITAASQNAAVRGRRHKIKRRPSRGGRVPPGLGG